MFVILLRLLLGAPLWCAVFGHNSSQYDEWLGVHCCSRCQTAVTL